MKSHMSERTILLTAAITTSFMAPVWAADTATSVQNIKDVIVTATRTEEEVKNVPNSVEVITAEDIQKLGAANVYDALKLANNVNIFPQSNDLVGAYPFAVVLRMKDLF